MAFTLDDGFGKWTNVSIMGLEFTYVDGIICESAIVDNSKSASYYTDAGSLIWALLDDFYFQSDKNHQISQNMGIHISL